VEQEKRVGRMFGQVPYYMHEIASQIINMYDIQQVSAFDIYCSAPDDIPNLEKVRLLLKDLEEVRADKLRTSMLEFGADAQRNANALPAIKVDINMYSR